MAQNNWMDKYYSKLKLLGVKLKFTTPKILAKKKNDLIVIKDNIILDYT